MSLDNLIIMMEEKTVEITKIVITGGPCAGKTTAMTKIQKEFEKKGTEFCLSQKLPPN